MVTRGAGDHETLSMDAGGGGVHGGNTIGLCARTCDGVDAPTPVEASDEDTTVESVAVAAAAARETMDGKGGGVGETDAEIGGLGCADARGGGGDADVALELLGVRTITVIGLAEDEVRDVGEVGGDGAGEDCRVDCGDACRCRWRCANALEVAAVAEAIVAAAIARGEECAGGGDGDRRTGDVAGRTERVDGEEETTIRNGASGCVFPLATLTLPV